MRPWQAGGGPDDDTLRRLVEEGLTDREIGARYGVSDETARYYRKRAGIEKDSAPHVSRRGFIPWTLNTKKRHHNTREAKALRALDARMKGDPVNADQEQRLDSVLKDLKEYNYVLDYDYEDGFVLRDRDPQLDRPDDWVRRPKQDVES